MEREVGRRGPRGGKGTVRGRGSRVGPAGNGKRRGSSLNVPYCRMKDTRISGVSPGSSVDGGSSGQVGEGGTRRRGRPKRGLAVMAEGGGVGEPDAKRVRGEGGRIIKRLNTVAWIWEGMKENEFVCDMCKAAARRAVRQFGLMGAMETGGIVLPYGESEVWFTCCTPVC